MSDPILNLIRDYTNVDDFVYEVVPRDGLNLPENNSPVVEVMGQSLTVKELLGNALGLAIPEDEVFNVLADNKLDRGEALGVMAGLGHRSSVQITEAEVAAMTERMEKWGLDASNPDELRMIEGLVKFDKEMLNNQEVLKISESRISDNRGAFRHAAEGLTGAIADPNIDIAPELDGPAHENNVFQPAVTTGFNL